MKPQVCLRFSSKGLFLVPWIRLGRMRARTSHLMKNSWAFEDVKNCEGDSKGEKGKNWEVVRVYCR